MSLKPDEQIALKFRDELVGRKPMAMISKFLPQIVLRFARIFTLPKQILL